MKREEIVLYLESNGFCFLKEIESKYFSDYYYRWGNVTALIAQTHIFFIDNRNRTLIFDENYYANFEKVKELFEENFIK